MVAQTTEMSFPWFWRLRLKNKEQEQVSAEASSWFETISLVVSLHGEDGRDRQRPETLWPSLRAHRCHPKASLPRPGPQQSPRLSSFCIKYSSFSYELWAWGQSVKSRPKLSAISTASLLPPLLVTSKSLRPAWLRGLGKAVRPRLCKGGERSSSCSGAPGTGEIEWSFLENSVH